MFTPMRSVFHGLGLGLGMLAVAGSAQAADIYTPVVEEVVIAPAPTWTGFYVGLHAGYAWGNSDGSTAYLPTAAAFGALPFSTSTDMDGFLGGAQAGYNWQIDSFLIGIEADISYADVKGSHLVTPLATFAGAPVPGWFQQGWGEMDWFGTVRARAGFVATPALLIYGTGGFAFGSTKYQTFTSFTPAPPFQYWGGSDETSTGWTIGAGFEWAFAPNWSAKLEYLYYDLGDTDYVALPLAANPPFAVTQSFDNTGSIVRVGVNYKFTSF